MMRDVPFNIGRLAKLGPLVVGAIFALQGAHASAQDPAPAAPTPAPAAQPKVPSPSASWGKIQQVQTNLGKLVIRARDDRDIPRLNCALSKQDAGNKIAGQAKTDLLVVGDASASTASKNLAAQKLDGWATRIEGVYQTAMVHCVPVVDDSAVNTTKTQAGEVKSAGGNNPSGVPVSPPTGVPVFDPNWLPTTSGSQ